MIINNYSFEKPLTSDNSGYSKWGIGERGGKKYFVKEFLSPVYPMDSSIYSEEKRMERIKLCESFEKGKVRLYRAIREANDGNVIPIEQFFRVGSKYYISTAALAEKFITMQDISKNPFLERLRLCCELAHAVAQIHEKGIVHSDIKPDNVLVVQRRHLKAYLIDFDCGFFEDSCPKLGEELNGDMVYLSPEAYLHIAGIESNLSRKMDVFALGLLLCQYLSGKLPEFDLKEYQYAYESVLDDHPIVVKQIGNQACADLISRTLLKNPEERPEAKAIFLELQKLLLTILHRTAPEVKPMRETPAEEKILAEKISSEKSSAEKTSAGKPVDEKPAADGGYFQTAGDL